MMVISVFLVFHIMLPSLTFEEAREILKNRSPGILLQEKEVEIAHEKSLEAKSSFYPSVKFTSSYTRLSNIPVMEMQTPQGTMQMTMGWPDNYQNVLTIALPIFTSGKRKIASELAEIGVETAKLKKLQTEREMEDNLIQVFFGLLMSIKARDLAIEAVNRAEEHLNVTRSQFQEGSATDLDVIRAEKDVFQAKAGVIQAENRIKTLYRSLNLLLGFPVDSVYPVEEGEQDTSIFSMGVDSLVSLAREKREEMRLIKKAKESASLNIKMNRASFLPDVAFFGNLGYNKPLNFDNEWGWDFKMGVSLSLPIFTGFSGIHRLNQAKRNLEKMELTERLTSERIEMEVRNLFGSLKEAEEELQVQKKNLELSEKALSMAKEQYRMGYITHTDYRDIEYGYMGARFGYLSALFNYRITLERLKNAVKWEVKK